MAAGYTIKELMEFMGHADLQMVNRYVKLLPSPARTMPPERLNDSSDAGDPADLPSQRGETWNDTEAINRHRALTPSDRIRWRSRSAAPRSCSLTPGE